MAGQYEEKRRSHRIPFEQIRTEVEIAGQTYAVRIADLSQEGVRLVLEGDLTLEGNEEVRIAVGKIRPNIQGRVRWVNRREQAGPGLEMGVEFESFLLEPPDDEEIRDLLEAWREFSHAYSTFESFLQILNSLDGEIVDGKIDDLSDAVYSVVVWLDQRLGPLNLWGALKERDGTPSTQLMVERHPVPTQDEATRRANVQRVAVDELTSWIDGRPYLFGGQVVIEYLGGNEAQVDLLQRLAVQLSRRIQFWSKLLMKNISLQLLSEEVERLRD